MRQIEVVAPFYKFLLSCYWYLSVAVCVLRSMNFRKQSTLVKMTSS